MTENSLDERIKDYLKGYELEEAPAEILVDAFGEACFDNDIGVSRELENELLRRLRKMEG